MKMIIAQKKVVEGRKFAASTVLTFYAAEE